MAYNLRVKFLAIPKIAIITLPLPSGMFLLHLGTVIVLQKSE